MSSNQNFDEFVAEILKDPVSAAAASDYEDRRAAVANLVRQRKAGDLTQAEVARRMGVSQPTVSEFENETVDPQLSTMQRYARAVGLKLTIVAKGIGR